MKKSHSLFVFATFACAPAFAQNQTTGASPVIRLEETIVVSTPLGRTLFEQVQPVSILKGDRLQLKLQPTLGETLAGTPGVSSTYFGPGSSRPIIRGLDGDRIRVLQNGVNTIDASATSADHAVSLDPVLARSIEVVRGPATLLYGSNAIGGVVNVIDKRIPDERIDHLIGGNVSGKYGSVNTERGGSFLLDGGYRGFAWTRLVLEAARQLGVTLTPEIAVPLFAAIATDTGWFRFSSARAAAYRAAAELIDAGVRPDELFAQLYERDTIGRVRLRGVILSRVQSELGGRLVHTYVLKDDFTRAESCPATPKM